MKTTDEAIWEAQPFVTCENRGDEYRVVILCASLSQAQDIHSAIVHNASARKKSLAPSGETMRQKIARLRTGRGGWSKKALAELGVSWPPVKGWKSRLIAADEKKS